MMEIDAGSEMAFEGYLEDEYQRDYVTVSA
jgi:hypothetical protein